MVLSNLFVRHKKPQPQFAQGLFLGLIVAFTIVGESKPIVGLAGLGTTLIVAAALVELNRQRIWEDYRKTYRKRKGLAGMWTEPNMVYYTINVAFLWPFIAFLGVTCIFTAYMVA